MRDYRVVQTSTEASAWLPMDKNNVGAYVSLQCVVTGTATYSVQQTLDDIFDSNVTPTAFNYAGSTNLTSATTNQFSSFQYPVRAVRINKTAGTGSVAFTVVQQGII
jgi:uncharacterized protein YgiM (DUF1202 family)